VPKFITTLRILSSVYHLHYYTFNFLSRLTSMYYCQTHVCYRTSSSYIFTPNEFFPVFLPVPLLSWTNLAFVICTFHHFSTKKNLLVLFLSSLILHRKYCNLTSNLTSFPINAIVLSISKTVHFSLFSQKSFSFQRKGLESCRSYLWQWFNVYTESTCRVSFSRTKFVVLHNNLKSRLYFCYKVERFYSYEDIIRRYWCVFCLLTNVTSKMNLRMMWA
jgi:hypothetical protein